MYSYYNICICIYYISTTEYTNAINSARIFKFFCNKLKRKFQIYSCEQNRGYINERIDRTINYKVRDSNPETICHLHMSPVAELGHSRKIKI